AGRTRARRVLRKSANSCRLSDPAIDAAFPQPELSLAVIAQFRDCSPPRPPAKLPRLHGVGCPMPPLLLAFIAAAIAGFSRGYAAFGTAMIYVPLITLAYDARTAVVTLFLIDLLPSIPLLWRAAPFCDRPAMLWMGMGALAASPFGVAILLVAEPLQSQLILG